MTIAIITVNQINNGMARKSKFVREREGINHLLGDRHLERQSATWRGIRRRPASLIGACMGQILPYPIAFASS